MQEEAGSCREEALGLTPSPPGGLRKVEDGALRIKRSPPGGREAFTFSCVDLIAPFKHLSLCRLLLLLLLLPVQVPSSSWLVVCHQFILTRWIAHIAYLSVCLSVCQYCQPSDFVGTFNEYSDTSCDFFIQKSESMNQYYTSISIRIS